MHELSGEDRRAAHAPDEPEQDNDRGGAPRHEDAFRTAGNRLRLKLGRWPRGGLCGRPRRRHLVVIQPPPIGAEGGRPQNNQAAAGSNAQIVVYFQLDSFLCNRKGNVLNHSPEIAANVDSNRFRCGEVVSFVDPFKHTRVGTITRVTRRVATVRTGYGHSWRVGVESLNHVQSVER